MLVADQAVKLPWSWDYSLDHDRKPVSDTFSCYRYKGMRVSDAQRRDVSLATPPLLLADWLRKPRSMLALRAGSREEAISWLWNEVESLRGELLHQAGSARLADDRNWRHVRDRFAYTWYDLGHDGIPVHHYWLTGGREMVLTILPNRARALSS